MNNKSLFCLFLIVSISATFPSVENVAQWLSAAFFVLSSICCAYMFIFYKDDFKNVFNDKLRSRVPFAHTVFIFIAMVGIGVSFLLFLPALLNFDFVAIYSAPWFFSLNFITGLLTSFGMCFHFTSLKLKNS